MIGVGNLGTALLRYNFSKNDSTKIIRAFDVNDDIIGHEISGVKIDDMKDIASIQELDATVAILTVPVAVAQKTADRIVEAGIKGIMNFTPARLTVPPHISSSY